MPRWYSLLSMIALPAVVFACKDDTIQDVDQSVCLSGKQWIGGKRGDPRMYPGQDCVGCHLDNDGPELMLGGTVYPYVEYVIGEAGLAKFKEQQSGEHCFGLEGVELTITGGDGQTFTVTTNEAGNFFVEGKATDLKKPFRVIGRYTEPATGMTTYPQMGTFPSYGGCARCHTPGVQATPRDFDGPKDEVVSPANAYLGVPGLNDDFFQ
jgi:hypothetical protein